MIATYQLVDESRDLPPAGFLHSTLDGIFQKSARASPLALLDTICSAAMTIPHTLSMAIDLLTTSHNTEHQVLIAAPTSYSPRRHPLLELLDEVEIQFRIFIY